MSRPPTGAGSGEGTGPDADLAPLPSDEPTPTISLIVPVYNAADQLPRLLESLDLPSHPEVELIVVDDASSDDTLAVAEKFRDSAAPGSVTVVAMPTNGGAGLTRRAGLAPARGKFLMWLDVDDAPVPGALDLALRTARTSPPDTVHVFDYRYRYRDGRTALQPGMTAAEITGFAPAVGALLRREISPYMWNKLVPREGLRPEHFHARRNGQDWLTHVEILALNPRVQRVEEVLVDYIQVPGTLSRRIDLVAYTSADASPAGGLVAQMRSLLEAHHLWSACEDDFRRWYSVRISANASVACARRYDPGPDDLLPAVAANIAREVSVAQILAAARRGDRQAAAALGVLRVSRPVFRRISRRGGQL